MRETNNQPAPADCVRYYSDGGVSVGTLYQYFPHKQALFYAVNERYLDSLAATAAAVRSQLILMCQTYLAAHASEGR